MDSVSRVKTLRSHRKFAPLRRKPSIVDESNHDGAE